MTTTTAVLSPAAASALEWDLIEADAALDSLAGRLAGCSLDGAALALASVRKARREVRQALRRLDGPISDLIAAAERVPA